MRVDDNGFMGGISAFGSRFAAEDKFLVRAEIEYSILKSFTFIFCDF